MFIIAVTGCLYAFQTEIKELIQSYQYVNPQKKDFLLPSTLRDIADKQLPGKHAHSVLYSGIDKSAKVIYYSFEENYYDFVYINQYTGEVLKVKDEKKDFFKLVLDGHFYLWLPPEIGQPVIATSTLVFVIMLISGLILWWPKNRKGVRKKFTIKWNARWRRKNYDLHNVIGFYISFIAIILALTGLVWGFEWFAKSLYAVTSGGKELLPFQEPSSDTTTTYPLRELPAVDKVWLKMKKEHSEAETIEIHFPENSATSILASINPDASTYWKHDFRYFDQYTLKELSVNHIWGRYNEASGADMLMRMNYDIHIGAILGFPGKILAFFASLLVASLPVTGFLLWWGRRNKSSKKQKKARAVEVEEMFM